MELGIVGLGKMGAGIARRIFAAGHDVVGFDNDSEARSAFRAHGISTIDELTGLTERLAPPRVIWMMVPAGDAVEQTMTSLAAVLDRGDILIDGGNSNYKDTRRRAHSLRARGIEMLDVGTSGGIRGEEAGYCLMIGGEKPIVSSLSWLWKALGPKPASAPEGAGWGHMGSAGAGHYAKMVHNGIEYGMMQALVEGLALLERHPDYEFDLARLARVWNSGSVIRSWLVELAGDALGRNPALDGITPEVADSGEGRWAVAEAIDLNVPAPVLTHALIARLQSRDTEAFSNRLLSALRHEFGGHAHRSGE